MSTEINLKKGMNKKRRNWLLVIAVLVLIIFLLLKFGFEAKGEDEDVNKKQEIVAYVEVETLGEKVSDVAKLERTAIFRSKKTGDVVAENTGRITQINFEIGDFVKQGQLLATFDQTATETTALAALTLANNGLTIALDTQKKTEKVIKESLELAKNARKIAELQYENAKNDPTEDENIAKRSYENAKDLEEQTKQNVKIQKNQAQSQVDGAKSALDGARVLFEKTILRAPISGKITAKNITVGDYVTIGTTVAGVVGEDKLEAVVSLNADQISRIKVGDEVAIMIGNSQHAGKIASLSTVANSVTQRFDVKIETSKELLTDANKLAKIIFSLALVATEKVVNSEQSTFFAPIGAVNLGQRKSVVFVLDEGKASAREIEVGEVVGDKIEIKKGVNKGEKLIIVNSRNLKDGQPVTTQKN